MTVPTIIAIHPIWFGIGEYVLKVALAILILLRSRGTPAVRLTWLVVVFAFPAVGVVAYLLVGETRLGRGRLRRYREVEQAIATRVAQAAAVLRPDPAPVADQFRKIAYLAETVGGNTPHAGNRLRLFGETGAFIDALVTDLEAAQRTCHLGFYIYLDDGTGERVGEALVRAVRRGVACRLLVDSVGSKDFLASSLCRRMEAGGVRVVAALPASLLRMVFARMDLRNHRKIVVIDGAIGYTGSQNIADPSFAIKPRFAPWIDAMVRVQGPAVADLHVLLVQDWCLDAKGSPDSLLTPAPAAESGGSIVQIMGTGPTANNEALRQLMQTAFHTAREELIITTPYFVPDEATMSALCSTANCGVSVSLVVPARNDSPLVAAASRSYYGRMLAAGVTIQEYQLGLLHAKTVTVDRELAIVSTANMDRRSFELNFEVSMVVYDTDFASELRLLQRSYMDDALEIDPWRWHERRGGVRFGTMWRGF